MALELWPWTAAALGGALIGFLLTVFGGGGSVLATPLLLYVVGVSDPHVAIGTSAAAVSLNALAALVGQAKGGHVKWPCALTFGGAGLAGSLAGAELAKHVEGHRLLMWFAIAMAAVGISMLLPRKMEGDPAVRLDARLAIRLAPIGLITGLAAGFFGIGGGFLIVPGLMAATGMTLAHAAAASLVSVSLFGAATSASYAVSGLVDWPIFLAMVLGGGLGTVVGGRAANAFEGRAVMLRRLFALMVVAAAAYVGWRARA